MVSRSWLWVLLGLLFVPLLVEAGAETAWYQFGYYAANDSTGRYNLSSFSNALVQTGSSPDGKVLNITSSGYARTAASYTFSTGAPVMCVATWYRPYALAGAGTNGGLFSVGKTATIFAGIFGNGPPLGYRFQTELGGWNANNVTWTTGTKYHIVQSIDSAGVGYLWVDNVLINIRAASSVFTGGSQLIGLGLISLCG